MRSLQKITTWAMSLALVACASTNQPKPSALSVPPPVLQTGAGQTSRVDADLRETEPPLKIGFVYVGPVGDTGWTYQHDLARKAMAEAYGDKVRTTYVQNVSEFGDGQVFRSLAANGHKLIFATTFGYLKQIEEVAKDLPDVKFEHAEGYKLAPNLRIYAVRTYESAYLAGMLAGGMTRTNRIGVVASIPIPEIIAAINAYTFGGQGCEPQGYHPGCVGEELVFAPLGGGSSRASDQARR
jgi:basic membrane protein A and related proteins